MREPKRVAGTRTPTVGTTPRDTADPLAQLGLKILASLRRGWL